MATPVYWYAPSGLLKNFVDRLTSMENMIFHQGRSLLEGKVAGFIVTGLDSGISMTITHLMFVLNSMGVLITPWSMAYSHMEDVAKDEKALRDAYNVGYLVVETIKAVKSYGKHIGYNKDVDVKEHATTVRVFSELISSGALDKRAPPRRTYRHSKTLNLVLADPLGT